MRAHCCATQRRLSSTGRICAGLPKRHQHVLLLSDIDLAILCAGEQELLRANYVVVRVSVPLWVGDEA